VHHEAGDTKRNDKRVQGSQIMGKTVGEVTNECKKPEIEEGRQQTGGMAAFTPGRC